MSWKGMTGCMGWSENDSPIVVELTKLWNELGTLDGYIYNSDDIPMPEHLKQLMDAINLIRNHLHNNLLK